MLVRAAAEFSTCHDNRPPPLRAKQLADALGRHADQVEGHDYALAEHLRRTARDSLRCGFDMIGHKCAECGTLGHPLPFTCKKSCLCAECARVDAAKKREVYGFRIRKALEGRRGKARLMFSTWSLRPLEGESIGAALTRARESWRLVWAAVYAIPRSRREWALYWELWPLRDADVSKHGTAAAAKRIRRRQLVADRRAARAGAVAPHELGPKNLTPHIHALILGPYVPQELLSRAWLLATGNSSHVFIQQARGVDGGIRETLKYLTKFHGLTADKLVHVYVETLRRSSRIVEREHGSTVRFTFRSMRSVECHGSFRKRHLQEDAPELRCLSCGGKMRPFGWIPGQLYRMGVTEPPEDYQFRPSRGPPVEKA